MTTTAPRITARIKQETQAMLLKAAAISGISSINSFVLNAAIEKAQKIIDNNAVLKLNEQDSLMLVTALDKPAQMHKKLQKAAKEYKNLTQKHI